METDGACVMVTPTKMDQVIVDGDDDDVEVGATSSNAALPIRQIGGHHHHERPKSNKTVKERPSGSTLPRNPHRKNAALLQEPRPRAISERGDHLNQQQYAVDQNSNPMGGGVSQFVDDIEEAGAGDNIAIEDELDVGQAVEIVQIEEIIDDPIVSGSAS